MTLKYLTENSMKQFMVHDFFWNYSLGAGNVNALRQSMRDKLEPLAPQVASLNRDGQLYIELSPCSF